MPPHGGHHVAEFISGRRVRVGFKQTDEGGTVYLPGMIQRVNREKEISLCGVGKADFLAVPLEPLYYI